MYLDTPFPCPLSNPIFARWPVVASPALCSLPSASSSRDAMQEGVGRNSCGRTPAPPSPRRPLSSPPPPHPPHLRLPFFPLLNTHPDASLAASSSATSEIRLPTSIPKMAWLYHSSAKSSRISKSQPPPCRRKTKQRFESSKPSDRR